MTYDPEACQDCGHVREVTEKKTEVWCNFPGGDRLCQGCWDKRWAKNYEASNLETIELRKWLREADVANAVFTLQRLAPEKLA